MPIVGNVSVASNITLFVFYYSIGVGLNLHKERFMLVDKCKYALLLSGFLGAVLLCYIVDKIGFMQLYDKIIGRFTPLPLLTAIGLVSIFLKFGFSSRIINRLAVSTFSVYLISENVNIYSWLWKDYFDNAKYLGELRMIPISLLHCMFIFWACILIDQVYRKLISSIEIICTVNGKK